MRGQQHGEAARFLQVVQHLPHRDARDRVEPCGRLVEKENPRIMHQAARNLKPPPHSARQRLGLRTAPLRQVDGLQHLIDVFLPLCPRHRVELGVDAQVFFDREVLVAGQSLRDDADHAPDSIGLFAHVVAPNQGATRRDRNERSHHANQRALPRPVWAQQTEDFSVSHLEVDLLHRLKIAVALHNIFNRNGRRGHSRGRSLCVHGRTGF